MRHLEEAELDDCCPVVEELDDRLALCVQLVRLVHSTELHLVHSTELHSAHLELVLQVLVLPVLAELQVQFVQLAQTT